MIRKLVSILMISALVVLQGGPVLGAAVGPVPIGQVLGSGLYLNGLAVPGGTTVMTGSALSTRGQAAMLHLQGGEAIQLNQNSSAVIEIAETGTVQLAVATGTVSYRGSRGVAAMAGPNALVSLGQIQTGQAVAGQQKGLVAVLTQSAAAATGAITVNDASRLQPGTQILLKSPDGSIMEIHTVASVAGNVVTLSGPLGKSFPAQTMVIVDDDEIKAAAAAGAGTVAGAVIGSGAAGVGGAGGGLGVGGVVGIIVGGTAGAGVAGMAATSGGDQRPASPTTP